MRIAKIKVLSVTPADGDKLAYATLEITNENMKPSVIHLSTVDNLDLNCNYRHLQDKDD